MKIGLVRRGFSATGGAEHYLQRFADAAVEAGNECILFTSSDWPRDAWNAGEIRAVDGNSPSAFADSIAALQPRRECDLVFSLERIWNCDCYRAGDGVHRAWLERRQAYEPKIRSWFRTWNPKHRQILDLETKLFRPEATRVVIANSQMVKAEIVRHFGYPAERIHVIYNGFSVIKSPTLNRAQLGLSERDFVVLFAGSGWERKGLRFAIDAIAKTRNATLIVAGRGNPKSFPAGPRVKFVGPVADMNSYLAAADLFLLPTIYDPFSNACLEALAAGLPVITTSANGFSEIIESGIHGEILADPSDATAMADAIEKWSDREKRLAFKPELQARAAQFDMATNLQATLDVLRQTAGSGV